MERFHQSIPRPPDAARLAVTPWSSVPDGRRARICARDVEVAAARLEPDVTVLVPRAAVLVGLVERPTGVTILLTRRALGLDRDPGLVAFPGGYIEPGEQPVDAALREAHEEVGLASRFVRIVGALGTLERPRAGVPVTGFLGLVDAECELVANADEVHEIFEVPVATLLADGAGWQEAWGGMSERRIVSFFADRSELGDNLVWGVTAAFIWRFFEALVPVLAD